MDGEMKKILLILALTFSAAAMAAEKVDVDMHGATVLAATKLDNGSLLLLVGGVDASGIVRQIQVDGKGRVICSNEKPSSRPNPYTTDSKHGEPGQKIPQSITLGGQWTPQVDAEGFLICSVLSQR
jgi:hypothetical protein